MTLWWLPWHSSCTTTSTSRRLWIRFSKKSSKSTGTTKSIRSWSPSLCSCLSCFWRSVRQALATRQAASGTTRCTRTLWCADSTFSAAGFGYSSSSNSGTAQRPVYLRLSFSFLFPFVFDYFPFAFISFPFVFISLSFLFHFFFFSFPCERSPFEPNSQEDRLQLAARLHNFFPAVICHSTNLH